MGERMRNEYKIIKSNNILEKLEMTMNCMKMFSRYQRAVKARLIQLSYMVFVMYHNISLFFKIRDHSVPSSVPHAQIPDRSPTKLLVNCEATFKDWKWNRVRDAARHGLVPLDAHSGARHRGEHEFVDLNIWGRIMASVELWWNLTFESQYQLLHGKFSQYPKEVQVEKTGIDFFSTKTLIEGKCTRRYWS